MINIVHTSDLHIGKLFDKYPEDIKTALRDARLESLENIVSFANENPSDILAITGDLFDRVNIPKYLINETAEILRAYHGLVLLLPGNHDFYSSSVDLWHNFKENMGDNLIFLNEFKKYDLKAYGVDAVIYPAFCQSKHSKGNNLGWIRDEKIDRDRINIGLAHGALEGISPDMQGEYFSMSKKELTSIPMDLWLLGHTHVPYPLSGKNDSERIFNAGVHEPDGMNYRHRGSFFYISLSKEDFKSERLESGKFRFEDRYDELDRGLDEYLRQFSQGYESTLLRLNLSGRLARDEYEARYEKFKELGENTFYLDIRDDDLKMALRPEDIDDKFIEGSFPFMMLEKLKNDEDALQLAYELIEESRER